MLLQSFRLTNFRRLKNIHVELAHDTSIFVGANNSGKTSATQAFKLFTGNARERFSIYDFHIECWKKFDALGENASDANNPEELPTISLDLWFEVGAEDLHRVIDLLPSLDWDETPVGLRIEFAPKDPSGLIDRFHEAKAKALEKANGDVDKYHPWPKSLTDYLKKHLNSEYTLSHYVLDYDQVEDNLRFNANYQPLLLGDKNRTGAKILNSLIQVDFLNAQRHLSDTAAGGRSENLSSRLSKFYERNLEKQDDDYDAMMALSDSEDRLNAHLKKVFEPTLESLSKLNYPGLVDPQLEIRSALKPDSVLNQGAVVHYTINDPNSSEEGGQAFSLPDQYNGLGYKNLIYMVVELLDFHERWIDEEVRAPLHIVFIEEPEAHLHVQLQQVFIRQVESILKGSSADESGSRTQLVVTTHSPHIIYESGFTPIRYFRRMLCPAMEQQSVVLNLSAFSIQEVGATDPEEIEKERTEALDFLQRYMKLTHCDLFFADGVILVEGNVERLLLPMMIEKSAQELRKTYLSILEVGGAYAHRFKELIDFLGLTTLIITDIDSVLSSDNCEEQVQDDEDDEGGESKYGACITSEEGAVTSNETLKQWIPKLSKISDLLSIDDSQKELFLSGDCPAKVRVAYQTRQPVSWQGDTQELAGRTLEESFALENIEWCQDLKRRSILGLRVINKTDPRTLTEVSVRLFKRVNGKSFKKTKFALGLLMQDSEHWRVPAYIDEGLKWLAANLAPAENKHIPNYVETAGVNEDDQ